MKKIVISRVYQSEIFEISNFLCLYFKEHKITIHKHNNKLILYFPKSTNRLKIQEVKTWLQVKYPQFQIVVNMSY
jgi:hypothetical protein